MLVTLLLWCLVTLTVFSYGTSFSKILYVSRILKEEERDFYRICLYGLAFLSTLLAFISIFFAIDKIVFFTLTTLTVLQAVLYRKEIRILFYRKVKWQRALLLSAIACILLFYAIISDSVDNDTGFYHAQAIQWIEKYPAVPGLGNLHGDLGNNIHFFLLCAFYSLSFTGIPFHALNSWIVLFFCFYCIRNYYASESAGKKTIHSLFLLMACFLYRWLICLPFTDIIVAVLTWIIFIEFLDYLTPDLKNKNYDTPLFMVIIGTFLLTCKLSFGFLFITILIFTLYFKLKEGVKALLKLSLILGIILLPWVARSLVISGYVFFPFSTFDIFKFSWRIPEKNVEKQHALLTTWTADPGFLKSPIIENIPDVPKRNIFDASVGKWFAQQSLLDKIYAIIYLLSVFLTVIFAVARIRSLSLYEKRIIIVWLILIGASLVWLINAPAFRFFYGVLWCSVCIPIMLAPDLKINTSKHVYPFLKFLPALIVLYFYIEPVREIISGEEKITNYFLLPKPRYRHVETVLFAEDNFMATRPKNGVRCWNEDIPCLPCELIRVKMRGPTFRDGFTAVNP